MLLDLSMVQIFNYQEKNEHSNNAWICTNSDHIGKLDELVNAKYEATCLRINKGTTKVDVLKKIC